VPFIIGTVPIAEAFNNILFDVDSTTSIVSQAEFGISHF